jgi:hypothetical protein
LDASSEADVVNRRGFLSALLATAAIPLLRSDLVVSLVPAESYVKWQKYTSRFNWNADVVAADWKYVCRLATIDCSAAGVPPDLFAMLARDPDVIAA